MYMSGKVGCGAGLGGGREGSKEVTIVFDFQPCSVSFLPSKSLILEYHNRVK